MAPKRLNQSRPSRSRGGHRLVRVVAVVQVKFHLAEAAEDASLSACTQPGLG